MFTCPEVDDYVTEKDGVRKNVEDDSAGGEVVVEEADGHREDYQVCYQQQQHTDVPVESGGQEIGGAGAFKGALKGAFKGAFKGACKGAVEGAVEGAGVDSGLVERVVAGSVEGACSGPSSVEN